MGAPRQPCKGTEILGQQAELREGGRPSQRGDRGTLCGRVYRESSVSLFGRQSRVTEGRLSTSPKTEGTRGHMRGGICGGRVSTEAAEGDAGRMSAGYSKLCQIQKTSGKWELILKGQVRGMYLKSGALTEWLGMAVHRVRDIGRSIQSSNGHCTGTLGSTECI